MAYKKLERRPVTYWRSQCETVGQMAAAKWDVTSECPVCGLKMRVNLDLAISVAGPHASLWNRRQACRRLDCAGKVVFSARPPELLRPFRLEAPWPGGRAPGWWLKQR